MDDGSRGGEGVEGEGSSGRHRAAGTAAVAGGKQAGTGRGAAAAAVAAWEHHEQGCPMARGAA